MSNRIRPREYHDEVFSTDTLGFRNPGFVLSNGPPRILLFGTSFSGGCGVTDTETLSFQLWQRLSIPVYNAADPGNLCRSELSLPKRLGVTSGVVVLEVLEREGVPPKTKNRDIAEAAGTAHDDLAKWIESKWGVSRLEILTRKFCNMCRNGWFLPRSEHVTTKTLRNGDEMLFYSPHTNFTGAARDPRPMIEHWAKTVEVLQRDNLKPIIFLVPEKFTVYGILTIAGPTNRTSKTSYLSAMEKGLRERGVVVVNLEPVFLNKSVADLACHKYLYRIDDRHWNPYGISVAAEAILPLVESALAWTYQTASN
jgi:hypothetical protein